MHAVVNQFLIIWYLISVSKPVSYSLMFNLGLYHVTRCFGLMQENSERSTPMYFGPAENSQMSNYKMVMGRFPLSLRKKQWSNNERNKLLNGVKQQCLEMLLLNSMNLGRWIGMFLAWNCWNYKFKSAFCYKKVKFIELLHN